MDDDASGLENIKIRGRLLGMTTAEIEERAPEIVEFAALGDHIKLPLRTYSSGMRLRLAFAIATSIAPDILLLDEIIGAGDQHFNKRATDRLHQLIQRSQIMVVASHSTAILETLCNKAMWLEGGRVRGMGDAKEVMAAYEKS
jgi:ABC-2 type transport system ATP-binding protein/lipopolysaccharide transport system ATP-binding protein